jgi:hypothetical protein
MALSVTPNHGQFKDAVAEQLEGFRLREFRYGATDDHTISSLLQLAELHFKWFDHSKDRERGQTAIE